MSRRISLGRSGKVSAVMSMAPTNETSRDKRMVEEDLVRNANFVFRYQRVHSSKPCRRDLGLCNFHDVRILAV